MVRPFLGRGRKKWPARLGSPLRRAADEDEDEWVDVKDRKERAAGSQDLNHAETAASPDEARKTTTLFPELYPDGRVTAAVLDHFSEEELVEGSILRRLRQTIRNSTFELGLLPGSHNFDGMPMGPASDATLSRKSGMPTNDRVAIETESDLLWRTGMMDTGKSQKKRKRREPGSVAVKKEDVEVAGARGPESPAEQGYKTEDEEDEESDEDEEEDEDAEEGLDHEGDYGEGLAFDDDEEYGEVDDAPTEPTL